MSSSSHHKSDNRRSVALPRDNTTGGGRSGNRRSSISSHPPNQQPEQAVPAPKKPVFTFPSDDEDDPVVDTPPPPKGKEASNNRSSSTPKGAHQRSGSNVDSNSPRPPNHTKGKTSSAASNGNNDHHPTRHRFTPPSHAPVLSLNRNQGSTNPNSGGGAATASSKRQPAREPDHRDKGKHTSTPTHHLHKDNAHPKETTKKRRTLFKEYMEIEEFQKLLTTHSHQYVQGVIRINRGKRSDAYVTVDTLPEGDVYISGTRDRNRALDGDLVGVELFNPEERPPPALDKRNKVEDKGAKKDKDLDDADTETDDSKPKYCGRVVAILEPLPRMHSGTLVLELPNNTPPKTEQKDKKKSRAVVQKDEPKFIWFKPSDKRVPFIAIPIHQAPMDFVQHHEFYARRLFVAVITRWTVFSSHPLGMIERELGDMGDIDVETEALLVDNNILTRDFDESIDKCLPRLPWTIPESEVRKRRDLRGDCVFTIDPPTAKDLDDAVSCTRLEDGTLEIGVHIADVTFFVKMGTPLDKEAKTRATTVYLVQKAVPMLPNILCENLCSLKSNVDRLAFSVFWKMTDEGEILDTYFSKTVIRSCAQLSYDDAQKVIKTGSLDPNVKIEGHSRSLVEENITIFFKLSQIFRQKRFENGALAINSVKLTFDMDESKNPTGLSVYELKESNNMIEEFMLLANMSVAQQISESFPDHALLRQHDPPFEERITKFVLKMKKLGVSIDPTSSGTLQRSLEAIQDPSMRNVVRALAVKSMKRSRYLSSGMVEPEKYHHYALNVPLYTHFTSPIRRYPDIVVHRMLAATLDNGPKYNLSNRLCQQVATHCNLMKDTARAAQDQSTKLYLGIFLKNMTESKGMLTKDAIVVEVTDSAFDVYVHEYGIIQRVHLDRLPLVSHVWSKATGTLKLYWTTDALKVTEEEEEPVDSKTVDKNRPLPAPNAGLTTNRSKDTDHTDDTVKAYEELEMLYDSETDSDDSDDSEDESPRIRPHGFSRGANGTEDDEEQDDENDDESDDESDEEDDENDIRRLTRIRLFEPLKVLVSGSTKVSPPLIKVVAMNPFAANK